MQTSPEESKSSDPNLQSDEKSDPNQVSSNSKSDSSIIKFNDQNMQPAQNKKIKGFQRPTISPDPNKGGLIRQDFD